MGNRNHRLACHHIVKAVSDGVFHFAIECRGRFIEQQNRGIFEHHTGDGNALALSARELDPSFTDLGIQADIAFGVT